MERPTTETEGWTRARVGDALRRRHNWEQLAKFGVVGATGYLVNLGVYWLLVRKAGVHYIPAAVGSFALTVLVAWAICVNSWETKKKSRRLSVFHFLGM